MEFRIADTFTESLARLTGEEQKAVKITAFDLQMHPAQPGMQLHKLDKARDPHFLSVRVSRDIRLIVHRTAASLLLCYVDHHDHAYRWAERRKLEIHPKTGAAQLVEIRETVQEILIPAYVEAAQPAPPKARLFEHVAEEALLSYGVPAEWLPDVRQANEDTLLTLADHLPSEAAEALLELATGGKPPVAPPVATGTDPFEHPDAQRRFRVMHNVEELATRPRISLGEMDHLPASGAAPVGGTGLWRPRTGSGLGRHRQDHRGPAPGRLSGPYQPRCQGVAHHLFRHPGACPENQTQTLDQSTNRVSASGWKCTP